VNFQWQLRAACGYAELGMTRQSVAELNAIEATFQARPEVLQPLSSAADFALRLRQPPLQLPD